MGRKAHLPPALCLYQRIERARTSGCRERASKSAVVTFAVLAAAIWMSAGGASPLVDPIVSPEYSVADFPTRRFVSLLEDHRGALDEYAFTATE